jgi:hypothetical protein
MIVPASVGDAASMIATAMNVIGRRPNGGGDAPPPPAPRRAG